MDGWVNVVWFVSSTGDSLSDKTWLCLHEPEKSQQTSLCNIVVVGQSMKDGSRGLMLLCTSHSIWGFAIMRDP